MSGGRRVNTNRDTTAPMPPKPVAKIYRDSPYRSRVMSDPHKSLAAAVIQQAIHDYERPSKKITPRLHATAVNFLLSDMYPFASILNLDPEKIRKRAFEGKKK